MRKRVHKYILPNIIDPSYIDYLEEENQRLKKAVAYSRQFYYLPQKVLDVFSRVVPETFYDETISQNFYNELLEGEDV